MKIWIRPCVVNYSAVLWNQFGIYPALLGFLVSSWFILPTFSLQTTSGKSITRWSFTGLFVYLD